MLGEIFLATAHCLEAIFNLKRFLVVIYIVVVDMWTSFFLNIKQNVSAIKHEPMYIF